MSSAKKFLLYLLLAACIILAASAIIGTIIFIAKITLLLAFLGGCLYIWQQYLKPGKDDDVPI